MEQESLIFSFHFVLFWFLPKQNKKCSQEGWFFEPNSNILNIKASEDSRGKKLFESNKHKTVFSSSFSIFYFFIHKHILLFKYHVFTYK